MARLRICQTLCVCRFMGVTRRTLSCLLVDKVSIERPKMLHLPGLGARTTLDQSTRERVHGHTCHLGNSRTRLALSISLVYSLSRAALLLHMHERTYTRTIREVAHKEDGSCTQAYPVHLLEGARFEAGTSLVSTVCRCNNFAHTPRSGRSGMILFRELRHPGSVDRERRAGSSTPGHGQPSLYQSPLHGILINSFTLPTRSVLSELTRREARAGQFYFAPKNLTNFVFPPSLTRLFVFSSLSSRRLPLFPPSYLP
ncbi:hypothetical protein J3E68DRAFT_374258 [Trichoderma sp. SZMC 28012]